MRDAHRVFFSSVSNSDQFHVMIESTTRPAWHHTSPLQWRWTSLRARKAMPSGSTSSSTRSFACRVSHVVRASFTLPCRLTDKRAAVPSTQDAWIQAHQNRYEGTTVYPFASWGLGANAANYVDDTTILSGCRIPSPHIAYCVW